MLSELISEADFDFLPADAELRWMRIESICRSNLQLGFSGDSSQSSNDFLRLQYMTIVASAARELGVDGVSVPTGYDSPLDAFESFLLSTSAVTTRLRLARASSKDPHSVSLSDGARGGIELEVERLRKAIDASDLDPKLKQSAKNSLQDLLDEIYQPRVKFAPVMAAVGAVAMIIFSGTSFLADAPDALITITSIIGSEKANEDATARITGPVKPRLIEGPKQQETEEDDIPF